MKVRDATVRRLCGICFGTGNISSTSEYARCPVCDGKGKMLVTHYVTPPTERGYLRPTQAQEEMLKSKDHPVIYGGLKSWIQLPTVDYNCNYDWDKLQKALAEHEHTSHVSMITETSNHLGAK